MSNRKKLTLTDWDNRLLEVLSERGAMTSRDIVEWAYDKVEDEFNAPQIIHGKMSRLIRKLAYNRDTRVIDKSLRNGPRPIEYSIRKRSKKS